MLLVYSIWPSFYFPFLLWNRKVLACVICGRLKSAFQIASRSENISDVQYVAHVVTCRIILDFYLIKRIRTYHMLVAGVFYGVELQCYSHCRLRTGISHQWSCSLTWTTLLTIIRMFMIYVNLCVLCLEQARQTGSLAVEDLCKQWLTSHSL